ncbi:hypothetical protein BC941DRAFT_442515 [Chlamydoabsidia padenii]|nr:hypothetical protein BC941DRAFT_442515 [Chlamydoabsidia padenii]
MINPIDDLTLELVLEDKAPYPFRLSDFIAYLDQNYCLENLAFHHAVTDYRITYQLFFGGDLSKKDVDCVDYLMRQFDTILLQFIHHNAPQEINIPADMKQHLLTCYYQQHSYHPSLLTPAYNSIMDLLRISNFIPFITDPQRLAGADGSSTCSSSSSIQSPHSRATYPPRLTCSTSTPLPWPPRRSKSSSSPITVSDPTPDDIDDNKPALTKRWPSPFKSSRQRSPSPRPVGGWRQITVHDTALFHKHLVDSPF